MKATFFSNYQLHKCCADDDLRPVMGYVHFMNGYAYATNAHVIVRAALIEIISECTPEMVDMVNNHSISAKNFARVIRHKEVEITKDGFVYANEVEGTETLYRWYEISENNMIHSKDTYKIPNMEAVLPQEKDILVPVDGIGVNVDMLMDLSNAMGGRESKRNVIDMYFTGDERAILCRKTWEREITEDVVGLIMPCIIDQKKYSQIKQLKQDENI